MRVATFNVQSLRLRVRDGRPHLDGARDSDLPEDLGPEAVCPDLEWADFAAKILATMGPGDEGAALAPGAPDQLVVQFPQALSEGMERPYFLQGDPRRPAYLWTWRSDVEGGLESVARGLGTGATQASPEQHVQAAARHADGEWAVTFRRALSTGGAEDLTFPVGRAVPLAFQAWDGDNGESGAQGSVSTWYFLSLEQPTPLTAWVAPPIALVLTLGFGLLIVRQARRAEPTNTSESDLDPEES